MLSIATTSPQNVFNNQTEKNTDEAICLHTSLIVIPLLSIVAEQTACLTKIGVKAFGVSSETTKQDKCGKSNARLNC